MEDELKPWEQMLMLSIALAAFFIGIHSINTDYRSYCRESIKARNPQWESDFACRYTNHPEKDSYWLDWLPISKHHARSEKQ